MKHSFNDEGRCVHCDARWHIVIGTACDTEVVASNEETVLTPEQLTKGVTMYGGGGSGGRNG